MSNLSDIGFSVETEEDLEVLAEKAYAIGQQIKVNGGTYSVYSDESGAELWLQLNRRKQFIGLNPHFKGSSRRKVALTTSVERKESVLDFALHAWAEPSKKGNPESGMYPFVFDLPDGKIYQTLKYPQEVTIQLTAFAQELDVFENEEAYQNKQQGELNWATHSFVPSGLFNADKENAPQAYGLLSGTIKQYKKLRNQLTEEEFMWLLVETLGGEIDVVADLSFFDKEPRIEGVIFGDFWLSGQIVGEPKQEKVVKGNFFSKLFGT